MKLILYKWGSNSDIILKKTLIDMGHEVITCSRKCEHFTRDLMLAHELINLVNEYDADGVVSNDYFPIISMVCNTTNIPYYSWVCDSPHYTLFALMSKYPCNRIGCFDRALTNRLNQLGVKTVHHLPLGVDWTDAFGPDNYIADISKYVCDVSFVGSLYTDTHNYYDEVCKDPIVREWANKGIKQQLFEYKNDYLTESFNWDYYNKYIAGQTLEDRVRNILNQSNLILGNDYVEDTDYIFRSGFLEKKITVEERKILLTAIANKRYNLALYTGSKLNLIPDLRKVTKGYIDYYRQMPYVFRSSRINLNITLRSIKTGIPLRALDIMGCGGFLLSNYQEELAENFKEGEELVLFYGLDDCIEKIDYYLANEEKRKMIAVAGYKAVKEKFNYRNQLEKLLNN